MAEPILLYPFRNRIKRGLNQHELMQWIEFISPDILKFDDDFVQYTDIASFKWGSKTNGTSAAVTGSVASEANGVCRLTTGTSSNGYAAIFPNFGGVAATLKGASFLGNNSAVMWARLKASAVTSMKIEMGFTDSDADAGAVNVLATPTTTAHDCAVWCYDTDDTAGLYWQGVCSANSTTPTKVEPALFLPVVATYDWVGVAILGSAVKFMRADQYGNPTYESAWQASGITATDALVPWIMAQTRNTTSKTVDIDYVIAYQRRTSAND